MSNLFLAVILLLPLSSAVQFQPSDKDLDHGTGSQLDQHGRLVNVTKEHSTWQAELPSANFFLAPKLSASFVSLASRSSALLCSLQPKSEVQGQIVYIILLGALLLICVGFLLRGLWRSVAFREKLEKLQSTHASGQRFQVGELNGMERLAQESRLLIKQQVNAMQEVTGALGHSIQTANFYDIISASEALKDIENARPILCGREVEDMEALFGRNAGAAAALLFPGSGLGAVGEAYSGRDKAPFRLAIGLPRDSVINHTIQVAVPAGLAPGQPLVVALPNGGSAIVAVPPGTSPGALLDVYVPPPTAKPAEGGGMNLLYAAVPGSQPNSDVPFLFLSRPFAIDCFCYDRPHVDVFHVSGGMTTKLGAITTPFRWVDMEFRIHLGADPNFESTPSLIVRGVGCQPGTMACCGACCGCCCGRSVQEAYLEVIDPKVGDTPVAFVTKGWAGAFKELLTSANNFYLDFGDIADPTLRSMLLATALFVDYCHFEGRAGGKASAAAAGTLGSAQCLNCLCEICCL